MMKKTLSFYFKLFISTFYISAFTFGGGYVIIPLLRKKFVDEYGWIDEEEMLDLVAIAQSSPGAIAVNGAIVIGYRLRGLPGVLISIIGTILPPFIILSLISIAYTAFIGNEIVQCVLKGMQAGVAAVIIDVAIDMIIKIKAERKILPFIIMAAAFIASFIFEINVAFIILLCGIVGAVSMYYDKKKSGEAK